MKYYLAPLEGITGYIFRNAYHTFFSPADKYFIPFIAPGQKGHFSSREKNDLLPEHNVGMYAVPQILTNSAEDFITTARELQPYGYKEINLNLGCPSKTVVNKFRGAGFLAKPDELDRFLDQIFKALPDLKISIKTRIGKEESEEFDYLLTIYNQFPLEELIIHPRVQQQFYKGQPHMDSIKLAVEKTQLPLCYNGDIFSPEKAKQLSDQFPSIQCIMLGRGILQTPGLIGALKGESLPSKETLRQFHDLLLEGYQQEMPGEHTVLFKMKEFWFYFKESFAPQPKAYKIIKKAQNYQDYLCGVDLYFNT